MLRSSRLCLSIALAASSLVLAGCPRFDVIAVSNTSYDFGLNDTPWTFQVWNSDPSAVKVLEFTVEANKSWIACNPKSGASTGPDDKKAIRVTINRTALSEGEHTGKLTISADDVAAKTVEIRVTSEGGYEQTGGWKLINVTPIYTPPYLVEFSFSLRDEEGHAVVAEPSQFQVTCMEDGTPISAETGAHFAKGVNKQLMTYLVLDYTRSMADVNINGDSDGDGISDAIESMQDAAKEVFLDSLNDDAQVGIYEFHRDDQDPQKVADFSADKDYLKERIDAIWTEYVRNFPAASRCWDALYAAVQEFGAQRDLRDEQRAIIFLSDGRDESSAHTIQEVIDAAKERGIAIYGIGFGAELDETALGLITSQTKGEYYPAATVDDLAVRFRQIVNDLGGQYILRWATLKRTEEMFSPSFSLSVLNKTLTHTAGKLYKPTKYEGDFLAGTLRLAPSTTATTTTLFLRATYVPRYITRMSFNLMSQYAFDVSLVGVVDGGVCADWNLTVEEDAETGERFVTLESLNPDDIFTAIAYAAFGPILKFEFQQVIDDPATAFDQFEIDNTLYAGGQSLQWFEEETQEER